MRRLKKWLSVVAILLAVVTLFGLTLNLYGIFDRPTRTYKVPNPDNLLSADKTVSTFTRNGISVKKNEDGSFHIHGTSTAALDFTICSSNFSLESGKTYSFSSGLKDASGSTYYAYLCDQTAGLGYFEEEFPFPSGNIWRYCPFDAVENHVYNVHFFINGPGFFIDETFYPLLIEGSEASEFYITVTK